MKEDELKRLIDKYFEGNSTDDEEIILKKHLAEQRAGGFDAERDILAGFSESENFPDPSEDLEIKILKAIDEIDRQESKKISKRFYISVLGLAATFLLLAGSYFLFVYKAGPKDTYNDPQIAYTETMKILNDISVKLNKGTEALQPINKMNSAAKLSRESIEKSTLIISNSLEKINTFIQLSDIEVDGNEVVNN